MPDIFGPLGPGEPGLGRGDNPPSDEIQPEWYAHRGGQHPAQAFGLIEFPFALTNRVQGDRDDAIPCGLGQVSQCRRNPEFLKEGFQPECPVVLVKVDGLPGCALGMDGRSRAREGGIPIPAVRAVEPVRDVTGEGEPASVAGRLRQRHNAFAAGFADQALLELGVCVSAELATFRIEEPEKGLKGGSYGLERHQCDRWVAAVTKHG